MERRTIAFGMAALMGVSLSPFIRAQGGTSATLSPPALRTPSPTASLSPSPSVKEADEGEDNEVWSWFSPRSWPESRGDVPRVEASPTPTPLPTPSPTLPPTPTGTMDPSSWQFQRMLMKVYIDAVEENKAKLYDLMIEFSIAHMQAMRSIDAMRNLNETLSQELVSSINTDFARIRELYNELEKEQRTDEVLVRNANTWQQRRNRERYETALQELAKAQEARIEQFQEAIDIVKGISERVEKTKLEVVEG